MERPVFISLPVEFLDDSSGDMSEDILEILGDAAVIIMPLWVNIRMITSYSRIDGDTTGIYLNDGNSYNAKVSIELFETLIGPYCKIIKIEE